jgi:hypothetical protein
MWLVQKRLNARMTLVGSADVISASVTYFFD